MGIRADRKRHSAIPEGILKETLVLTFDGEYSDTKVRVYRETVRYIAENLPNAEVYQFVNNEGLLNTIEKYKLSSVISTNEIPHDTALFLKGMGVVQILIGTKKELLNICDIIIDPLVSKSESYLVGTRYLLPSILTQISPNALAEIMKIDAAVLTEEVSHNEADAELLSVVKLYQKLEWDSKFFGINIGYISCLRLTPNIEKHIKCFTRREKIDLLEYLCNCHDRKSVVTSEKNGYSFVDIRLTFEKFLNNKEKIDARENYSVRKGNDADIEKLKKIATGIYKYSRYYFDDNFNRDRVVDFYTNWVEKAVCGQFDDYTYILCRDNEPVGFCTIKKMRRKSARIGLFGMSSECAGRGLAQHLLDLSLEKLREEEGVEHVEVVTQGRNYSAQRLYQRCGFITKTTELWYHKWFH